MPQFDGTDDFEDNDFLSGDDKSPEPAATPPRPKSIGFSAAGIPDELKKLDRWILWKYSWMPSKNTKAPKGSGKWTKTPHSAISGYKTDATDVKHGTDFVTAVQYFRRNRTTFDGLGFILGEGYGGVDFDDCMDEYHVLDERGQRMSAKFANTYAEISPSGRGFKAIVNIGDDPKLSMIGRSNKELEIYGGKRYFTVTGAKLDGHPNEITHLEKEFAETAASIGIDLPTESRIYSNHDKESLGWNQEQIRELFDALNFSYIEDYGDWIRGGMAIHHETDGSQEGLELWDVLSQRCGYKYEAGMCEQKWHTFGRPGKEKLTLRGLIYEARKAGRYTPTANIEQAIRDFTPFTETEGDVYDDAATEVASELASNNWWAKYCDPNTYLTTEPRLDTFIFEGLLRVGKIFMVGGSGGSSKSFLMLHVAMHYALGNDWGPFVISKEHKRGKVLLMYGEEDSTDLHVRVHALKEQMMLTDEQVQEVRKYLGLLPLRGKHIELVTSTREREVLISSQLKNLEDQIVANKIVLVVLDPLALFHSLEENDNVLIASLVRELDAMCMRTGCAMIIVHHFSKVGSQLAHEVNEHNIRGASSLNAHVRGIAVMHRLRRLEAPSWGIAEEDAHRWVMLAVVKTNYAQAGLRYWFETSDKDGTLLPSQTQLEYRNTRDIRAAAQAFADEQQDELMQQREAERELAEREKRMNDNKLMRFMMRKAIDSNAGALRKPELDTRDAQREGIECSEALVKRLRKALDERGFTDSDGMLNHKGLDWLDSGEILGD